jgi:hypothetical protein
MWLQRRTKEIMRLRPRFRNTASLDEIFGNLLFYINSKTAVCIFHCDILFVLLFCRSRFKFSQEATSNLPGYFFRYKFKLEALSPCPVEALFIDHNET